MPPHDAPALPPWEAHHYRDENARLLVRAIHFHRDNLLAGFSTVPVQDYAIRGDGENDDGALSLGALITLWLRSPDFSAHCFNCHGIARVFSLTGGDLWAVRAVCESCGFSCWRSLPEPAVEAVN